MKRSRKNLIITLSLIFLLMSLLVIFTSRVIFRTAFSSAKELGENKTAAVSADLENYLETAKSVLWLAADTVDHMVAKGATNDEIVEYITRESERTEQKFDDSYTGLYGVIRGEYVDGVGWVPPADYDPTKRDWYKTTIDEQGDVIIVSPYVDAQTGNVIISVGRSLTDNNNALALDLTLNEVQEIVENIQINGYGYGYIVNYDGMVIAHEDREEKGKNYNDDPEQHDLFQKAVEVETGYFETDIDGDKCTVFVDIIMDQWYLVVIIRNSELYRGPMSLMVVSIIINLIVFLIISAFYILGYRHEVKVSTRMEEMKEVERKKDYEAKVLKLEKSAADSANKAKSNFLADMSHEIRTPINAILGMNEMILHESGEKNTLEYATNIKTAGTTLLSIINTILDFSKIEDGRMSLVPAEFETLELINSVVISISERAKDKGLELRLDIDEAIPKTLLGDDVRIGQVVMNILTNAVKYTEKGFVLLKMEYLSGAGGDKRLFISVRDTGIGIKQEDMDKLSISFERVDEERNRHIEGTGLGISIVTKLLTMMKSELQIRSEYGVGSEFYFELPIQVVDETPIGKYDMNVKNVSLKNEKEIGIIAPEARVILTDDNEMNRKVAANLLGLFGIKPAICKSGVETIELMKKSEFDLLLLDHMMPEMDGIETLRYLKEMSILKNTRVIALTANAVVGAREQYIEAGFDDYISKPIDIPELEKILIKYLPEELLIEKTLQSEDGAFMEFIPDSDYSTERHLERPGNDETPLVRLEKLGLNVSDGIKYCGGDEEFYLEIVSDYVKSAPDKIKQLDGYIDEGNLKDYKIQIHAVKSSSNTIGALEFFEKARALEIASGENDTEYINSHHSEVMQEYAALAGKIGKVL